MTSIQKSPHSKSSLIERAAARIGLSDTGHDSTHSGVDAIASTTEPAGKAPMSMADATGDLRRSREVVIDSRRLRAQGCIVPNGERNRTAEEFRFIKRTLLTKAIEIGRTADKRTNVIMVTSARPGEGKTFISLNLAISIALERDLHVLLIDGDFAQPRVLSTLGLKAELGLSDVLLDESLGLADVMLRTSIGKLSIVPPGRAHVLAPEILSSNRAKAIAEEIAWRYSDRIVICDSPPLLATAEPGILIRYAGQIVVVVEADKTSQAALQAALDVIGPDADVSLILNKVRFRFGSQEFGSYYQSYQS